MVDVDNINALIEYGNSQAQEFNARLNRIRSFVKHNLTSGTANETILRGFLTELSPKRYGVAQGFLCDPIKHKVSRQCDIIVYDHSNYAPVHSEGDIRIVWPQSVRMVIEVKTHLNKQELYKAIENTRSAIQTQDGYVHCLTSVIFAYGSSSIETIVENLKTYQEVELRYAPDLIVALDKKMLIIHEDGRQGNAYEVREASEEGVVLTYLLLLFITQTSAQMQTIPAQAALQALLQEKTSKVCGNIEIGVS